MSELNHPEYIKFKQLMDEYINNNHLDAVNISSDITMIVNHTQEELTSLSEDECIAKSYQLLGFAMYIQNQVNYHKAILDWCLDTINSIVAKEYNNFSNYMKHDIRVASVIQNNDFGQQVDKLRQSAQTKVTLLTEKNNDIRNMARILEQIARRKAFK